MNDDPHEYVSPAPKRTFAFSASVRMGGPLKPLPYTLPKEDEMTTDARVAELTEALREAEAILSLLYYRVGLRTSDGQRVEPGGSSSGEIYDAISKARAALGDR